MKRFADKLKNLNIYDKILKNINCCPHHNYEVLASLVKFAKEKHLPSKIVKYNKRKHMKHDRCHFKINKYKGKTI